jgi:hypothetical protein
MFRLFCLYSSVYKIILYRYTLGEIMWNLSRQSTRTRMACIFLLLREKLKKFSRYRPKSAVVDPVG